MRRWLCKKYLTEWRCPITKRIAKFDRFFHRGTPRLREVLYPPFDCLGSLWQLLIGRPLIAAAHRPLGVGLYLWERSFCRLISGDSFLFDKS
ncbi:hypothetical protein CDAR_172471 [Caerostris darwini]|uniref:Uncharacterized protein n=1 Tax=Caerostris darwini TaxID=1538125 RepID=A0AAV4MGI4_9ARAC|nr:hypothetical protein CDAR_172471 [Caerostris darwini]